MIIYGEFLKLLKNKLCKWKVKYQAIKNIFFTEQEKLIHQKYMKEQRDLMLYSQMKDYKEKDFISLKMHPILISSNSHITIKMVHKECFLLMFYLVILLKNPKIKLFQMIKYILLKHIVRMIKYKKNLKCKKKNLTM